MEKETLIGLVIGYGIGVLLTVLISLMIESKREKKTKSSLDSSSLGPMKAFGDSLKIILMRDLLNENSKTIRARDLEIEELKNRLRQYEDVSPDSPQPNP